MFKNKSLLSKNATQPLLLVVIGIVAIIAVVTALYQLDSGPLAPTAPVSQPSAAEYTSGSCALTFVVAGPTSTPTHTPTATPVSTPVIDLELDKAVSNSTPKVGEQISYTIDVYNDGPDTATGVTVTDVLPSGLTYVSSNPSQGIYNDQTDIWTIGTINTNATQTLRITVRVDVSSVIVNYAQVETHNEHDIDSQPGDDSGIDNNIHNDHEDDDDQVTINPQNPGADLSLTKRVNNSRPNVGDTVRFTIEVRNSGPNQADNVTVEDLIPTGTTFVAANPSQGSYNSGSGIWTIGSMPKDFSVAMELDLRINVGTTITNIAQVETSSQPDPDSIPGNNNPNEDDQDDATINPSVQLPTSGSSSQTTLFVVATGIVVLIVGAMGLLLLL